MVHKKTKKSKQSKSVLTPFGYFVLGQMSMNTRTLSFSKVKALPINSPSPLYIQTTPQLMTQPMQYPIITSASPSPLPSPSPSPSPQNIQVFPANIPKIRLTPISAATNMIPPTPFSTIPTQSLPPQSNFSFFEPPSLPAPKTKIIPSSESSSEMRRFSRNKKNT